MKGIIVTLCCLATVFMASVFGSVIQAEHSQAQATDTSPATIIFCDVIDDDWNPVKPVTTIKKGQGVNFLTKLTEGIAVVAVVWDIYQVGSDGKDMNPSTAF